MPIQEGRTATIAAQYHPPISLAAGRMAPLELKRRARQAGCMGKFMSEIGVFRVVIAKISASHATLASLGSSASVALVQFTSP